MGKRKPPLVMKTRRWRRSSLDPARPDLPAKDGYEGKFDAATMDLATEFPKWSAKRCFPRGLKKHLIAMTPPPTPIAGLVVDTEKTGVTQTNYRTWYFHLERGKLVGKIQRWSFPRLSDIDPRKIEEIKYTPQAILRVTESNIDHFEMGIAKLKKVWLDKSWDKFSNVVLHTTHSTEHGLLNRSRIDFQIHEPLPGNFIFRVTNRHLDSAAMSVGIHAYCYRATVSWHFSRCDEFIPRFERFLAKFRELQVPYQEARDKLKNAEFKLLLGTPEQEETFYKERQALVRSREEGEDEINIQQG